MTDGSPEGVVKKNGELPYDERPVIKIEVDFPAALEPGEYLLQEAPLTPTSPPAMTLETFFALPPTPKFKATPVDDEMPLRITYSDESPVFSPKALQPKSQSLSEAEDQEMLTVVPKNSGLELIKEIELGVLPVPKEPDPEIDELAKRIAQAKVNLPENILNTLQAVKEGYIQAKFNPTDPKEKARLEHRLKVYTYPNSDDIKNKQDAESKREKLREEFSREFEEGTFLKHEENNLLDTFAGLNFTQSKPHYWETPEKHFERTFCERQKFIQDNRAVVLSALKEKIREGLTPAESFELDCEENLQKLIEKPLIRGFKFSSSKPSPTLVKLAKKHKQDAKPAIELLFRARKGLADKQELYSSAGNFCKYREKIGDAIQTAKQDIASEDEAKKGFKRLGGPK